MLKPLGKNVVVAVQKQEKMTASGIFLADTSNFGSIKEGVVVAVGNDVSEVKEQDAILFPKECGVTVKHKGEEYIVLSKDNILAVVKDD